MGGKYPLNIFHIFFHEDVCRCSLELSNQHVFCGEIIKKMNVTTIPLTKVNPSHAEEIKMPHPLPIFSQSDLIQVVDINSHPE